MKRKLLAVMPQSTNYLSMFDLSIARSFEEAKRMMMSAEAQGCPYDDLDLPVSDEKRFWQFVEWMEETGRRYSFSVFGYKDTKHFCKIAEKVRDRGFHFNS